MASVENENAQLLSVNFNQDFSSVGVGSHAGYRLYSLGNIDKLEVIHQQSDPEEVFIVERLFSSSLIAVVSQNSPRKLKVCHFKKGTEICNYSYSNSILAVRLNRQRLVVCLEESIYIHNIRDMKVLHTVRETPVNTAGLLALSVNADASYVAYPGSSTTGELQVFDALNLHATTVISAHNGPLAALAFNPQATMIATASEKGTVVRVFSVLKGDRLYEFRRGMKRCVQMSCLSFSLDSNYLVSSSNTETVHVYKLEPRKPSDSNTQEEVSGGWMEYMRSAVRTTQDMLLPTTVSDMLTQDRAIAWARLPVPAETSGKHHSCICRILDTTYLLVASSTGYLYFYSFEAENGGECTLKKTHRLTEAAGGESLSLLAWESGKSSSPSRTLDAVSNATPPRGSQPYREVDETDDAFPVSEPTTFNLEDQPEFVSASENSL